MPDNSADTFEQQKIEDTLKRLVRILARQTAREVFELQSLENSDEVGADKSNPESRMKQS